MADESKFGERQGLNPGGNIRCEEWEALLTDALDDLLPASETAAFAAHGETCPNCSDLLAHVKQGREWLGYLHTEPEIPAGLVSRIIEKTVGVGAVPVPLVAAGADGGAVAMAMPWRRNYHETRLLMTVAMAFFSIALTLSMVTGGKLTTIRLADLRPSQIGSTLSREFYGARKGVVQYYDNMRIFYQLQSRMRELRRDVETQPQQQQQNQQQQQQKQGGKGGSANAGQGTGLRAAQGAGYRVQGTGQRIADSVQRSEERLEAGSRRLEAGSLELEEKQTAVVVGLKSVETGSSITLGRSGTGLQDGNVEGSLV